MIEIREYNEGMPVEVVTIKARRYRGQPVEQRLVIVARNQAGYDFTRVDLLDVIQWVKENRPDLLTTPNADL